MTERLPDPEPTSFPSLSRDHVRTIAAGTAVGRIYSQAGPYPATWNAFRRWGPTSARFDHQPPPSRTHATRSIMYLAPAVGSTLATPVLRTCVAECFSEIGTVDLTTNEPYYVIFRLSRAVRLLDLADSDWVALAGGNSAIQSGPRDIARKWARAIYDHYTTGVSAVDGLYYGCSIIPSARSVVLWGRAADALPIRPAFNKPLSDSSLRSDIETFASELQLDLVS